MEPEELTGCVQADPNEVCSVGAPNDEWLRQVALDYAVTVCGPGNSPGFVVDTAEDFLKFLKGE